jgi:hypothetical protein
MMLKILHSRTFQLVDKYLKSVDNSKPLDKIMGFLVGPMDSYITRERLSRTRFLELRFDFFPLGRQKFSYPQPCG